MKQHFYGSDGCRNRCTTYSFYTLRCPQTAARILGPQLANKTDRIVVNEKEDEISELTLGYVNFYLNKNQSRYSYIAGPISGSSRTTVEIGANYIYGAKVES